MNLPWSRSVLPVVGVVLMMAVLVAPAMGAMGPALGAVDITGNNIRMDVVGTKEECSAACDAEPACVAATFVLPGTIQGPDGHCYLKSAAMPQTDNFNCYSFTKQAVLPELGCGMSYPSAEYNIKGGWDNHGSGSVPLTIQFTDLSTGAMAWSWDFGDGSPVSHEKNPAHTYTTGSPEGTKYEVTLTVTGACPFEIVSNKKSNIIRIFDKVGFLTLASTPVGAAVTVDGKFLGKTTTTASEGLPLAPGGHTVLLTLDGYKDHSATVTIFNGVLTQFAPVLEKTTSTPADSPPSTGSLQIMTTPDGASVSIDGGSGGTTPLTLSGLAAGSHTVKLTKTGYTDYQATVTVTGGQTTPLNVKLVAGTGPAPITTTTGVPTGTGSISVTSSPSGASVNLDGWDKGTTPVTLEQVKTGTHTLTLKKTGYQNSVQTVTVTGGSTTQVNVQLVPQDQLPQLSGSGTLIVSSIPAGASVYLDGEKAGTTPARIQNVTAGTHRLLLTLPGYPDNSQTIEISSGSDKEMSIDFGPKMAPESTLPVLLGAGAFIALVVLIALVLWNKKKNR